jgi:hypothetical protein
MAPLNRGNLIKEMLIRLPPLLLKKLMVAAVPGAGERVTPPVPTTPSPIPPTFQVVPLNLAIVKIWEATEGPSREEQDTAM